MSRMRSRQTARARRRFLCSEFDRLEDRTAPATGSIRGTLWDDANANQVRDAGEAVLAGRTIYLDLDRDVRPGPRARRPPGRARADGRARRRWFLRLHRPGPGPVSRGAGPAGRLAAD